MISFGKNIIVAIILLFIAPLIIKWTRKKVSNPLTLPQIEPSSNIRKLIRCIVSLVCWLVLMLVIFFVLGINLPPFIIILAMAGLFIAVTYSSSILDFVGGLKILLLKPFVVNDYVEVDKIHGRVINISLQKTTLITDDNKNIEIHNAKALKGMIKRHKRQDSHKV